jgi:hypothetical protein
MHTKKATDGELHYVFITVYDVCRPMAHGVRKFYPTVQLHNIPYIRCVYELSTIPSGI